MTANELDLKVCERVRRFDWGSNWEHFALVGAGQQGELRDTSGQPNRYYKWLACLIQELKPKQVTELGAAAGISTLAMSLYMPPEGKIISVDYDPTIAWQWMKPGYPNVIKILGDDLDLSIYPKDIKLDQTDIWFIDSLHTEEQLRKEFELYTQFFKKGAVVVLDDIHINEGMQKVWEELPYDKYDTTNPNHYSGFGHFIYDS